MLRPRLVALVAIAAVAAVVAPAAGRSSSRPRLPSHDPFYRYSGTRPLGAISRGAVLNKRAITVTLGPAASPLPAEQLLYRTRDRHGRPTVTVTTVIEPAIRLPGPDIVDYLSFYDGFGPECDPSYTLAGGYPGSAANQGEAEEEELLILHYVLAGLVVTVPDFEGERWDWGDGVASGYGALDAITATESYLGVPATTKVGLSGYSGGAIAADWASELAPRHARRVHLVGVAEGGIPVDLAHNLRYVNGSDRYSGTIPGVLLTLHRSFGVRLDRYLSRFGRRVIRQVHHDCIAAFLGRYPGLTITRMMKPHYRRLLTIPSVARGLNQLIMGRARGAPMVPLFMGIGDSDGRGDGVMLIKDTTALAHEYCRQRVAVRLTIYSGPGHELAGADFEPAATAFLLKRFLSEPFTGNCRSIGSGGSLAPLPVRGGVSPR